jgi:hypothetical protein
MCLTNAVWDGCGERRLAPNRPDDMDCGGVETGQGWGAEETITGRFPIAPEEHKDQSWSPLIASLRELPGCRVHI